MLREAMRSMNTLHIAKSTLLVALVASLAAVPAGGQQPGPAAGQGAAPQGARPAGAAPQGGGGPRASQPLGDGPWDFQTERAKIHVSVVTKGLDHPWGMAFLPNGDMLVTERPGRLRVVRKDGKLEPTPIGGLPKIRAAVIGGLLDVALHPQFARNRLVYFSYSKPDAQNEALATTAVARGKWDGGSTLTEVKDIFVADSWYSGEMAGKNNRCCGQGPADGSYGSRIVFDKNGYLFITIGDRNWGEKAQDPSSHLGKIVRVRDDGSVPKDNPFVGKEGYKPDLWTIGHRNPLGLTIHPVTGELWESEFGPRGGDEVNKIEKGKNYGWILVTEGEHYNGEPTKLGKHGAPGMVDPVLFWVPSINPGNLAFYEAKKFPDWRGNMLMATMTRSLVRATFDKSGKPTGQEKMLTELGQRLRDVRVGPDGLVYVLTDETGGAMLQDRAREVALRNRIVVRRRTATAGGTCVGMCMCVRRGSAERGAAGSITCRCPIMPIVGMIEDVTVVHPHAGALVELHGDRELGLRRHADRVLPFRHPRRVEHLEEIAVQVERMREVGVVHEIPDLRLAEPRLERLRALVRDAVEAHHDAVAVERDRERELLLRRTRDVDRLDVAQRFRDRLGRNRRRVDGVDREQVLARPIERAAVAAIDRHPLQDLVAAGRVGRSEYRIGPLARRDDDRVDILGARREPVVAAEPHEAVVGQP